MTEGVDPFIDKSKPEKIPEPVSPITKSEIPVAETAPVTVEEREKRAQEVFMQARKEKEELEAFSGQARTYLTEQIQLLQEALEALEKGDLKTAVEKSEKSDELYEKLDDELYAFLNEYTDIQNIYPDVSQLHQKYIAMRTDLSRKLTEAPVETLSGKIEPVAEIIPAGTAEPASSAIEPENISRTEQQREENRRIATEI